MIRFIDHLIQGWSEQVLNASREAASPVDKSTAPQHDGFMHYDSRNIEVSRVG